MSSNDTLARLAQVIESRRGGDPNKSYVARLFSKGGDAILKKVGEEATETVMAGKEGDRQKIVYEVADLWFHSMLLLAQFGLKPADVLAELAPEASYPSYGYGLVLLWAMLLAARTEKWWWKGLIGSLLLLPAQAWGICFQWLRDVVLLSGPSGAAYLNYPRWAGEAVAYGYQFGFLMLTPMAPILLWLLFNKRFLAALWLEAALEQAPEARVETPTQAVDKR